MMFAFIGITENGETIRMHKPTGAILMRDGNGQRVDVPTKAFGITYKKQGRKTVRTRVNLLEAKRMPKPRATFGLGGADTARVLKKMLGIREDGYVA